MILSLERVHLSRGPRKILDHKPRKVPGHDVQGAEANADGVKCQVQKQRILGIYDGTIRHRNPSHPNEANWRSFWRELPQIVDPQLLLQLGDLVHHFEEAFLAKEFVFFFLEVIA